MFIINQSNSNNQLIVNKNLLKHEQRINRKDEKASVVKLTWPTLLTTINSSRKESTGNNFSSFKVVFFAWYRKIALPNDYSDRQLF